MSKPNLQNRQTASGIATIIYTVVDSSAKETTDYNGSDCLIQNNTEQRIILPTAKIQATISVKAPFSQALHVHTGPNVWFDYVCVADFYELIGKHSYYINAQCTS